jgi:hypothetical protein
LKIIFIGNFEPSWSTESHLKRSLEALGYSVLPYQENSRDTERLIGRTEQDGYPLGFRAGVGLIDLLLWTRTWGVKGDMMGFIRNCPIPTVSYHLDLYIGLQRGANLERDPFWNTRYVFTPDGGSQRYFDEHGINHYYLRPGVFGEECYLAQPNRTKYPHEIIFVGSEQYHVEWPYRGKLIKWLRENYGDRFKVYGSSGQTIRGHELNVLYASAKIAIGDTLCLNFNHPNYVSDRLYEGSGRGAFQIFPYIPGITEELKDGEHLSLYRYNDWDGLRQRIDYYLSHDEERERIRVAGHEQVKAHCTYVHRCAEMLAVVAREEAKRLDIAVAV